MYLDNIMLVPIGSMATPPFLELPGVVLVKNIADLVAISWPREVFYTQTIRHCQASHQFDNNVNIKLKSSYDTNIIEVCDMNAVIK